jgi:antitoxin component YwqK of YwqJK toxin-antitoxin module
MCYRFWSSVYYLFTKNNNQIETNEINYTITNESGIYDYVRDPLHAKYAANMLKVIKIINIKNKETIESFRDDDRTIYSVDKIVRSKLFDVTNLNDIYARGIQYFKSFETVYYQQSEPSDGYWITRQDDGSIRREEMRKNNDSIYSISYYRGSKTDESILLDEVKQLKLSRELYPNGNKIYEAIYIEDAMVQWYGWYENGTLKSVKFLVVDVPCRWKKYYEDSSLKSECEYLNDNKSGLERKFYPNKNLRSEGRYIDGKKTGLWKKYFENSELKSSGMYEDGIKVGRWHETHDYSCDGMNSPR